MVKQVGKDDGRYLVSARMPDILSESAIRYLPFKPECIDVWRTTTDLARFLFELFNQPYFITAPDGTRHEYDHSDYGDSLFEEGLTDMRALAHELTQISTDSYHQDRQKNRKKQHNFLNDREFGRAAKAIVAWKGIDNAILSESAFVSIYHLLEAGSDLDCSLALVKKHYYKQAGYCLRAFVENVTLPLYFSRNSIEFTSWKKDQFRVPRFRGKNGLLDRLLAQKLISKTIADQVGTLYGRLNAFVHSSIESMIHKGHDTGDWRGLSFKLDEFHTWSALVAECVDAGIRMMKIQTDLWLQTLRSDPEMCAICHSHGQYTVKRKSFGVMQYLEYTCKQCGHKTNRRLAPRK